MENMISISIPYRSKEDFEESQRTLFQEAVKLLLPQGEIQPNTVVLLTRKQVAEKLHISLPTLNSLTKYGTLKGYRLNGRVLYKEEEVINALERISILKYRRAQ